MPSDAITLLTSRLTSLRSDHLNRLLGAATSAARLFEPFRRASFDSSLETYAESAIRELADYGTKIRGTVLDLTNQLLLPLTEDTKQLLLVEAATFFDETLYAKRYQLQVDGMLRNLGNFGYSAELGNIRTDIQHALHNVGAVNTIRRSLASLADELELVRLRSAIDASNSLSQIGKTPMQFAELRNDTIDLICKDGTTHAGLKASVQKTKIFLEAGTLLVQTGDLIVRRMSNGGEETFRVIDPGYREPFLKMKASYQMEVEKLGLPEARSAVQNVTYNISGPNARVNQGSVDNSTNIMQVENRAIAHLAELRGEIENAQLAVAEKSAALEVIDEVDEAFKSGKPKKSIVSALLSSLPHVANVSTIVAAINSLL